MTHTLLDEMTLGHLLGDVTLFRANYRLVKFAGQEGARL
jgi:hypothetical protein